VGLGYVGLPVAATFSAAGFRVVGVDTSEELVAAIEQNRPTAIDVEEGLLAHLCGNNRLTVGSTAEAEMATVMRHAERARLCPGRRNCVQFTVIFDA
jgi:UDP-N-acetyl-D-mannosaminuronate dehydrogenase